jgi:hypothetical protein
MRGLRHIITALVGRQTIPRFQFDVEGNRADVSSGEIDRALATITQTMNDQRFESLDAPRVQELIASALGGEVKLSVDDGGGIHDETGARVGAIRRDPGGTWIAERQNSAAERSDTAIPNPADSEPAPQRRALEKLKKLFS